MRWRMRVLAMGVAATSMMSLPQFASAQESPAKPEPNLTTTRVAGKVAFDAIRVTQGVPSIPLRHPGVVPQTEEVTLDGVRLRPGDQYSVDHAAGVIFLKVPAKDGQWVRVSYRYEPVDPQKPKSAASLIGSSSLQFQLGGGSSAVLGLGLTERASDGRVYVSNVYGLRNQMSFGAGALKGMFVVGDRKEVQTDSLLETKRQRQDVDTGKAQALLQQLESKMLGGTVRADLVDIQKNFSGFQALRDAGYEENAVQQMSKEKGLRRVGLSLNGLGGKGLGLNYGYRTVKDKDSAIQWRSLGMETGSLSWSWNSQRVDSDFTRFGDLAEADREWLSREKGMNRESLVAQWKSGTTQTKWESTKAEDEAGKGLYRRSASLEQPGLKLNYRDQEVEKGFERFGHLREGDRDQLSRERGWRRQNIDLDWAAQQMKFSTGQVRGEAGRLQSLDLSWKGKNWSLEHVRRDVDKEFRQVGNLPGGELQSHLQAIARMYQSNPIGIRGEEPGQFVNGSPGLDRSGFRFQAQPHAKLSGAIETTDLKGQDGGIQVRQGSVQMGSTQLRMREQRAHGDFKELSGLIQFERDRLSVVPDLRKSDFSLRTEIGKGSPMVFEQMRASTPRGDASRMLLSYSAPQLDMLWRKREVDSDFTNVGQLVDPDREIFGQMIGFSQSDLWFKTQRLKGVSLDLAWTEGHNPTTGEVRMFKNSMVGLKPTRNTDIQLLLQEQKWRTEDEVLRDQKTERIDLQQKLNADTTLRLAQEKRSFDGKQVTDPDSKTDMVSLESKVSKSTTLRTEQARTQFSNGDRETTANHTLTTQITPRTGVSVSHATIQRPGEKRDETRRQLGFYIDFGKGIKLEYGYNRSLLGERGEYQSRVGLTAGQFQGIDVRSLNYQAQRWDGNRNLALGNVQLATSKPLQWGAFRDVQFYFGADTVRDHNKWQRENRRLGISGSVLGAKLSYDFQSQVLGDGKRAIDRTYRFETPGGDKATLKASASLKVRSLPDKEVLSRNYSLTYRPMAGVELQHQVVANPETARGDAILGSVMEPTRLNRWALNWSRDPATQATFSWEERRNERDKTMSRLGAVSLTLFANNPSPLYLTYGLEQIDQNGQRRTAHRYGFRFDQRPGPNQILSFSLSNLNWQHSRAADQPLHQWQLRLDYQLRLKN